MKTLKYTSPDNITIEYIFMKAKKPSQTLVVAFPGAGNGIPGGDWAFLFTLGQLDIINVLLFRTDTQMRLSAMTFVNGQPLIENALKHLIDLHIEEHHVKKVIAIGSSNGGFDAFYYGLKYNWHFISGSPFYSFTNSTQIQYATGKNGEQAKQWLNEQIYSVVLQAGQKGYNKEGFIFFGEGEYLWRATDQGVKLISDLDKSQIQYTLFLCPFADHVNVIHRIFPKLLLLWLKYFLELRNRPTEDEMKTTYLMTDGNIMEEVIKLCASVRPLLAQQYTPDLSHPINNCMHYGDNDSKIALRNYNALCQNLYWDYVAKAPIQMNKDAFWLLKTLKRDTFSFYFQDTLLNYCEKNYHHDMLEWLTKNSKEYLLCLKVLVNTKFNDKYYNCLLRIHFFIAFHNLMLKLHYNQEWLNYIPQVVLEDLSRLLILKHKIVEYLLYAYNTCLAILHVAVYFKNNQELFIKLYDTALNILNKLITDHFDENGVCLYGSFRMHIILLERLHNNIVFIQENDLPQTNELEQLTKHYKKILICAQHLKRPDGRLASIGDTILQGSGSHDGYFVWSSLWIQRISGNFIKRLSNIAILEDHQSLSYITVNGGRNIRDVCIHYAELSFTWYYDGKQIFYDSGGSTISLLNYASLPIAHNALICEGHTYKIPEYDDFTTINTVDEQEHYIYLSLSHNLITGITLSRKFIWIKPNIIILFDSAVSEHEENFSQNFLLDDFTFDKIDQNTVVIKIIEEFTVTIKQYEQSDGDFTINEFHGTTNAEDIEHHRGSLMQSWGQLRKGLNLVYTKTGKEVSFLTAIECHSPTKEGKAQEYSVQQLLYQNNQFIIALDDGREIKITETVFN